MAELAEHLQPGGVTAAAINAGIGIGGRFATETSLEDELRLIRLDVEGAVHLTKHVVEAMIARARGRSSSPRRPPGRTRRRSRRSTGEQDVPRLVRPGIRAELEDAGTTVTSLMPGPTETDVFHRAGMDDTKIGASEKQDPAEVARIGFEALLAGEDHVVQGKQNALLAAASRILPDPKKAAAHGKLSEPGGA